VVKDATGAARHVYVTNSTSGTVTCLTPSLTPRRDDQPHSVLRQRALLRLPLRHGRVAGRNPHLRDDGGRPGTIDVIDSKSDEPDVQHGRSIVHRARTAEDAPERVAWPHLLVPITTYDANYMNSRRGLLRRRRDQPRESAGASRAPSPSRSKYHFATEVHALSNGRILVTIGGEVYPTFYECFRTEPRRDRRVSTR
jgi:hypothetical protein